MRHSLTFKEKIDKLNSVEPATSYLLTEEIVGEVQTDYKYNRLFVKYDFREELKRRMKEEGITQVQLAKRLGIKQPQVSAFLHGKDVMPYRKLEELMWLMKENTMIEDRHEQTTYLRIGY